MSDKIVDTFKVFQTSDYSLFKFIKGNRVVNENHVNSLARDMKECDLHHLDPIEVDEKMNVSDGQHRLLARKKLKLPVFYMIKNSVSADLDTIQRLNTHKKNWTGTDILNSKCILGHKEYILIKKFMEIHQIGLTNALMLLGINRKTDSGNLLKSFILGTFKIHDINTSGEYIKQLKEIGKYYPEWNRRSFVRAMIIIFSIPEYNHKRMMDKVSQLSQKIYNCPDTKLYLKMMEEIYNWHQQPETFLRFL